MSLGNLKLTRQAISLDFETTGVDPVQDRIIQAAFIVINQTGERFTWETFINPEMHIPEDSTAVHGITDEMVKDAPVFSQVAARIHKGLQNRDIIGYNPRSLDLPILDESLRRSGLKLDLTGVRVIDAAGIFFKKEPRTLTAAVAKYCGRSHEDAHGAAQDADATADVLIAQLGVYEDLAAMTLEELAAYSLRGDNPPADLAGKLYRDADGDLRYAFGKCRDVKVRDDVGFGYWMLKQTSPGFPGDTCEVLRAELDRI